MFGIQFEIRPGLLYRQAHGARVIARLRLLEAAVMLSRGFTAKACEFLIADACAGHIAAGAVLPSGALS